MKGGDIKKAVARAAAANLSKAIKEEGQYRARDQVRQAMNANPPEGSPAEEAAESQAQEVAEQIALPGNTSASNFPVNRVGPSKSR